MRTLFLAAVVLFLATLLGAIGAHTLRPRLEEENRTSTWKTAVDYHFWHGFAILATAMWRSTNSRAATSRRVSAAVTFWLAGLFAFSGSLYILAVGGPRWLGVVTPIGGLCFLAGWAMLALAAASLGGKADPAR